MKRFLKTSSLLICSIFTVQTVVWSSPSVFSINVNEKHGVVSHRYKGEDERVIIHVQDAHANSLAQENMAKIICDLLPLIEQSKAKGETIETSVAEKSTPIGVNTLSLSIPFIGIEGASSTYSLNALRENPLLEARTIVGRDLVKEGKLIAVEYANMIADQEFNIAGLEDQDLFAQDLAYFKSVMENSGAVMDELQRLETIATKLKMSVYNAELKKFDQCARTYENDMQNLLAALGDLYTYIDQTALDILNYVNLLQFKEAYFIQKMINEELLAKEVEHLVRAIGGDAISENENLIPDTTDLINTSATSALSLYAAYQEKSLTEKAFLKNIAPLAVKGGVILSEYPNIQRKLTYWNKYALIDMGALLAEAEQASRDVRDALSKNEKEKALVDICFRLSRAKKLFALRAVKAEVEEFRLRKDDYAIGKIKEEIAAIAGTTADFENFHFTDLRGREVGDAVDMFYQYADKRDKVMLDKLLSAMSEHEQTSGVLVAGGYHSEGLTRLMREKGVSYVTVTPSIDSVQEDIPYLERLTGKLASFAPSLSTTAMNANQINAPIQALNAEQFQTILKEAGVRIDGQTVLDEKGALLSKAEIRERVRRIRRAAQELKLADQGASKKAKILADILETIIDEIESIARDLLKENGTASQNTASFMEKLRPILQERLGSVIDSNIFEREETIKLVDAFLEEMNTNFLRILTLKDNEEKKDATINDAQDTRSQNPRELSQETPKKDTQVTLDEMIEALERAEKSATNVVMLERLTQVKAEIDTQVAERETKLEAMNKNTSRYKVKVDELEPFKNKQRQINSDIKQFAALRIKELEEGLKNDEVTKEQKQILQTQLELWEFIFKFEIKNIENMNGDWNGDTGSDFDAPAPAPAPSAPSGDATPGSPGGDTGGGDFDAPAPAPDVPEGGDSGMGSGESSDFTPPDFDTPPPSGPSPDGGIGPDSAPSVPESGDSGSSGDSLAPFSDSPDEAGELVDAHEATTDNRGAIRESVEPIDTIESVTGNEGAVIDSSSITNSSEELFQDKTNGLEDALNLEQNESSARETETSPLVSGTAQNSATGDALIYNNESPLGDASGTSSFNNDGSSIEDVPGVNGIAINGREETPPAKTQPLNLNDSFFTEQDGEETIGASIAGGLNIPGLGSGFITTDLNLSFFSAESLPGLDVIIASNVVTPEELSVLQGAFTDVTQIGEHLLRGESLTEAMRARAANIATRLSFNPAFNAIKDFEALFALLRTLQSLQELIEKSLTLTAEVRTFLNAERLMLSKENDERENEEKAQEIFASIKNELEKFSRDIDLHVDTVIMRVIQERVEKSLSEELLSDSFTREAILETLIDPVLDTIGADFYSGEKIFFNEEYFLTIILNETDALLAQDTAELMRTELTGLKMNLARELAERGKSSPFNNQSESEEVALGEGSYQDELSLLSQQEKALPVDLLAQSSIDIVAKIVRYTGAPIQSEEVEEELARELENVAGNFSASTMSDENAITPIIPLLRAIAAEIRTNRINLAHQNLHNLLMKTLVTIQRVNVPQSLSASLNALLTDLVSLTSEAQSFALQSQLPELEGSGNLKLSDQVEIGGLAFSIESTQYSIDELKAKLPIVSQMITRAMYGFGDTSIKRVRIVDEKSGRTLTRDTLIITARSIMSFNWELRERMYDYVDFEGFTRGEANGVILGYEIMQEVGLRSESVTDLISELYGSEFKDFIKEMNLSLSKDRATAKETMKKVFTGISDPELEKILLADGTYDRELFRDTFLARLSDDILIDKERAGSVINQDSTLNTETLMYLFSSMMKKALLSTFEMNDKEDGESAEDALRRVIHNTFTLWGNTLDLFVTSTESEDQKVSTLKEVMTLFMDGAIQKAMSEFDSSGKMKTTLGFWGSLFSFYEAMTMGFSERVLLNAFLTLNDPTLEAAHSKLMQLFSDFFGIKKGEEDQSVKKREVWVLNDELTAHEVQHIRTKSKDLNIIVLTYSEFRDWKAKNWDTEVSRKSYRIFYFGVDPVSDSEEVIDVQPDVQIFVGKDEKALERMLAVFRFDIVHMVMNITYEKNSALPDAEKIRVVSVTKPADELSDPGVSIFPDLRAYPERDKAILENVMDMMKEKVFMLAA
jgi:hypothetical protein